MVQDFKVSVPTYNDRIIFPLTAYIRPSIIVTNIGDEEIELGYSPLTELPLPFALNPQGITKLPRFPVIIHLSPNESTIVHAHIPSFTFAKKPPFYSPEESGEYTFSLKVEFFNVKDPSKIKRAELNYRLLVVTSKELENTSIRGYVYDKETGKPIPDVEVILKGIGGYNPSGATAKNGLYEVKCHGDHEYQIEAEAPGYGWDHRFVKPIVGGPLRVDLHLKRIGEKVEYDLKKIHAGYPGNIQGYMSRNGKYIIFGYRPSKKLYNTIYFFDVDGNLLWSKTMDSLHTTPSVNISDDGSYVAVATLGTPSKKGYVNPKILLFDNLGKLLWKIKAPDECREVTISHNNKYFACQGGLDICLCELETGELLWRRFTGGQARIIKFTNNDSHVYASSGSGYLYKYNITGEFLWKTFIGSFVENHHGMAISLDDSYILTVGHDGEANLIDSFGNIIWSFEFGGYGTASIAPDNSYFLVASKGPLETAKIDIKGNISWIRGSSSGFGGKITEDGKYLATAKIDLHIFDINGNSLWSYKPDLDIEKENQQIPLPEEPGIPSLPLLRAHFLAITPNGSKIIVAYNNGTFLFFQKG